MPRQLLLPWRGWTVAGILPIIPGYPGGGMQYSGVLVATSPQTFDTCLEALALIPGVGVHHAYPDQGRAVVVLETESLEDQERTFRTIQELPGVLTADLVYHYVDAGEPS